MRVTVKGLGGEKEERVVNERELRTLVWNYSAADGFSSYYLVGGGGGGRVEAAEWNRIPALGKNDVTEYNNIKSLQMGRVRWLLLKRRAFRAVEYVFLLQEGEGGFVSGCIRHGKFIRFVLGQREVGDGAWNGGGGLTLSLVLIFLMHVDWKIVM